MLLHTNDGSNAVITVPRGKEDAFAKSVQGTRNKDLLDTKEWNFTAKNYLIGNWSTMPSRISSSWWRLLLCRLVNFVKNIYFNSWDFMIFILRKNLQVFTLQTSKTKV